MRVIHIERAEGIVPGLYDVKFDDGGWAMDLTVGQVRQLAPDVPTERFTWWDESDPSVECAYPPCTNRLRRAGCNVAQWCSKEHRSLTLVPVGDDTDA